MSDFYTIKGSDIDKATIRAFGKAWLVSGFLGRVMAQDVGKRVYLSDGILQVENREQFEARVARESN